MFFFERLSGQLAQLISKVNRRGIRIGARALIPTPQDRTQLWQEQMLNRLMDS